jgi:hypothetical protein
MTNNGRWAGAGGLLRLSGELHGQVLGTCCGGVGTVWVGWELFGWGGNCLGGVGTVWVGWELFGRVVRTISASVF